MVMKITKEHKGRKYDFPIGAKACNVETDTTHQFVTQTEKNKINEIDDIKQSFRDGCKMIVDRLTALGYGPAAPQGPGQIVTSINTMYEDRYNAGYVAGRTQGRNDVKDNPNGYGLYSKAQYDANYTTGYNDGYASGRAQGRNDVISDPGAYGIDTGIKYSSAVTKSNVDGFSLGVHRNASLSDPQEVNQTANRNIELKAGNKILYSIDITQKVSISASYEGRISGESEWTLKTVEGEVIKSGTAGSLVNGFDGYGNADAGPDFTNNINIDLFETPFTTAYTYVTLSMHTILRASCGAQGSADGNVAYVPITAKYK